jgi:hypothetical protein
MLSTTLSHYTATQVDYKDYIIDAQLMSVREGGRLNQSIILKYEDGTEWIYLGDKPQERFCGFLYLQKALKESNLNHIQPAENKMAIHERKIIYLSKYCGEKRPNFFEHMNELQSLKKNIGFTDIDGCTNLREEGSQIYVFDTEKASFDSSVHEKIDSFVNLHNAIRAILEEKLKD